MATRGSTIFEGQERERPTIADIEEVPLYLTKTGPMKIEGGFIVIHDTMRTGRLADRRTGHGKGQYRPLDEFHKQRVHQVHIAGEHANLTVSDYNTASQAVNDHFTPDFRKFINHYFKEGRRAQTEENITPEKCDQLFGELSESQREIIDDKRTHHIAPAAGPGSGKTRAPARKLASLSLLEDVKHEQPLTLTFSRAATTEFKKRLIDLAGNAAHFVDIKTTLESFGNNTHGNGTTLLF